MKVAILTLPLHTNYGGILQAYALQTVLERMGHEVKVLTPPPYKAHPWYLMPFVYCKRIFNKLILKKDISILYDGHHRQRLNTDKFIREYIHLYLVKDWAKLKYEFDGYIVGSDQIWRPKHAGSWGKDGLNHVFLDFAQNWNVKKIAYAISFGTKDWEYSQSEEKTCNELAQKFNQISVREKSGVILCKEHFHINPVHVLDPTMLLSDSDYISLINTNTTNTSQPRLQLMCYILDSNSYVEEIIKQYEKAFKIKALHTNAQKKHKDDFGKNTIQPPVEHWLQSFRDAAFIITDSFHACVFSIIFRKNFGVIINNERGASRIYSLLESLGLECRIIDKENYTLDPINYDEVYVKLHERKEDSISFIKNSLKE